MRDDSNVSPERAAKTLCILKDARARHVTNDEAWKISNAADQHLTTIFQPETALPQYWEELIQLTEREQFVVEFVAVYATGTIKNIPHTSCDLYSAALTYDKRGCLSNVKKFKIPTAKSVHLNQGEPINLNQIISKVGLPCFVKANRAGSSFGVYKIFNKKDLIKGIKKAYDEDSQLIIESELKGREVSVGVYKKNNKVICLPITEIISENEFFDYEAKYMGKAKEITPAEIPVDWKVKVNKIAKSLYENLNLKGVCRSEFIFVENKPHLLEINTVPGLTEESIIPKQCKAAGIKLGVFFEDLLNEVTLKNS